MSPAFGDAVQRRAAVTGSQPASLCRKSKTLLPSPKSTLALVSIKRQDLLTGTKLDASRAYVIQRHKRRMLCCCIKACTENLMPASPQFV